MEITEEGIFEVMNFLEDKSRITQINNIPKEVCKYRKWKSKIGNDYLEDRVITNLELFHASPEKFHDKDDCRNKVDYYELLNNKVLQNKFITYLAIEDLKQKNKPITFNAIEDYFEKIEKGYYGFENTSSYIDGWIEDEWKKFCSFLGVLSFCKTDDNEQMWRSEYAKDYTGVCYVFNFELLKNDFDNQGDEYSHYNVNYEENINKISVLSSIDLKILTRSAIKLKDKYSHEDEFRVCLQGKNLTLDLRKRYFSIKSLNRIILGHNMSKENFLAFAKVLKIKDQESKIILFRTSLYTSEHIKIKNYIYWN